MFRLHEGGKLWSDIYEIVLSDDDDVDDGEEDAVMMEQCEEE